MIRTAFIAALALACLIVNADAKPRSGLWQSCIPTSDVMRPCAYQPDFLAGVRSIRVVMKRERRAANVQPRQRVATAIVAHPPGCPARAFCGCGAAVRIFGKPIRDLWLAANWFKFPQATPGAGMVAVRKHHVFVLEQHLGGDTWLAYDANSGRHQTRIHARSIAGYAIVNPHGAG